MSTKRLKTMSKSFFNDEIHHIELTESGEKIIHLHQWVHRTYNPHLLDYDRVTHRNEVIDNLEKYKKAYIRLYGEGDFTNNESYD